MPHPGPWINPLYSGYWKSLFFIPHLHSLPYTPIPTITPTVNPDKEPAIKPNVVHGPSTLRPTDYSQLTTSETTRLSFDPAPVVILGGLFILVELLVFSFLYYQRDKLRRHI